MSKFKYLFLSAIFHIPAIIANVYAAERAYQVVLPIPNQTDILVHVFTPPNTPKGVLIALHGCGGLLSTNTKNGDKLSARHAAMAEFANRHDWIAVFPDSFTTRGRREICTQKFADRTIKQSNRKADVLATAQWVKEQDWFSSESGQDQKTVLKTVLLGWSNGGTTVLETIEASPKNLTRQPIENVTTLVDQAVAFYPGCSAQLARGYRTHVPLTLFLGKLDDWTPAQPCIDLGKHSDARVYVYPEAYHGFDNPTGSVRLRKDVPNGVNPGQGVHVGAHPSSRQEAYEILRKLLEQQSTLVR